MELNIGKPSKPVEQTINLDLSKQLPENNKTNICDKAWKKNPFVIFHLCITLDIGWSLRQ